MAAAIVVRVLQQVETLSACLLLLLAPPI